MLLFGITHIFLSMVHVIRHIMEAVGPGVG